MTALVRRAGRATLEDGTELLWSVADGRRGRRWRAEMIREGRLERVLLLEAGVDGRAVRLELAAPAGLLTLHPEASGGLHGNAVTASGVRHFTFEWSDEHGLELDGLPITSAVTASRLAPTTQVGEGRTVPVVVVGPDLTVRPGERRYRRLDEATWEIEGDGRTQILAIDERGVPAWREAGEWPLELDPRG
jgi:hypothetical protein